MEGFQYLAFNNSGYVAFAHSARRIIVGCSGATRRGGVITAKRVPRCRLRRNCLQTFNIGRVGTIAVKARQPAAYENWRSWKRHSDRGSTQNVSPLASRLSSSGGVRAHAHASKTRVRTHTTTLHLHTCTRMQGETRGGEEGRRGRKDAGWRGKRGDGDEGRGARRNHRWLPFITPRSKHGPESGPLGRLHEERWFAWRSAMRAGPRAVVAAAERGWRGGKERGEGRRGEERRGEERSERAPRRNRPGTREPLVQPAITRSIASRKRAFLEARDKRLSRYAAGNGG